MQKVYEVLEDFSMVYWWDNQMMGYSDLELLKGDKLILSLTKKNKIKNIKIKGKDFNTRNNYQLQDLDGEWLTLCKEV